MPVFHLRCSFSSAAELKAQYSSLVAVLWDYQTAIFVDVIYIFKGFDIGLFTKHLVKVNNHGKGVIAPGYGTEGSLLRNDEHSGTNSEDRRDHLETAEEDVLQPALIVCQVVFGPLEKGQHGALELELAVEGLMDEQHAHNPKQRLFEIERLEVVQTKHVVHIVVANKGLHEKREIGPLKNLLMHLGV